MSCIAHFGAFDHDSYGDLLFPFVIEHFNPQHTFVHVSPFGLRTPFADARPSISIEQAFVRPGFDSVVLGGGNLMGFLRWAPRGWRERELIPGSAFLAMWASAFCLARSRGLPLALNASGVNGFDPPRKIRRRIADLLSAVTFASVRDRQSAEALAGRLPVAVTVVPDSALLVSRMWPVAAATAPRVVVCASKTEFSRCGEEMRVAFGALRAQGLSVYHLSLMNHLWEYEPQGLAASLAAVEVESAPCETAVRAWAEFIGSSDGYVGNSMHGLVTAVAYRRKAVLVVARDRTSVPKYRGFLDACGLPADQFIAYDWKSAVELYRRQTAKVDDSAFDAVRENFRKMFAESSRSTPAPQSAAELLDGLLNDFCGSFLRCARVKYKWSLQANGKDHPLTRKYRFASRPLTSWLYRLLGGGL